MRTWKIAPCLLLCLLLLACLLPAAFADGLSDLQTAIDSFNDTGSPNSFLVTEDISAQNVALTIPGGFTLTVSGQKRLQTGDFTIAQGGAVVLDGGILTTNTGALTLDGTLAIENYGRYTGDGKNAAILKAAHNAHPQRLILEQDKWSISTFEAVDDEANLQTAIDNADEIMDTFGNERAMATIQIYFDWTIIKGRTVDLGDAVIELDKTLTVCGTLKARQFSMHPSGTLIVDGGMMVVPGTEWLDGFNISNPNHPHAGGTVSLTDAWIDTNLSSWQDVADAVDPGYERISFEGDAGFIFHRRSFNNEDATAEDWGAITGTKRILESLSSAGMNNARAIAEIACEAVITEDMEYDIGQGEIAVCDGGSLTICGKLTTAKIEVGDGGSLVLTGGRLETAGLVWETPPVADLALPADLQTIGAEAFAGGCFRSVSIPAGVVTIADDAFGDRTDMLILGELDSAAETFAENRGFSFIPVASAS